MRPINTDEIQNLRYAIQHFQDCYLVSSIGALANSSNGRKILSNNIVHTPEGFRIRFNNVNGATKDYFISQNEMDKLIYMDRRHNPIEIEIPHNPIIKAIEIAMNKLLHEHPNKKPWICRFAKCNEKFEFNKPSNFLEMFTGIMPIKLNENGLKFTMKSKKQSAKELFEKIRQNPDNSFVVGTLFRARKELTNAHCYSVIGIDRNTLKIFDHGAQEIIKLNCQSAIKRLKYIVGYFNNDLI